MQAEHGFRCRQPLPRPGALAGVARHRSQGWRRTGPKLQRRAGARPEADRGPIEALQSDYDAIVLPLDLKPKQFKGLRVGKKLSSRIKVNGPCKQTTATASTFRDDVCTVSGSFTAVVKRLPGKGRGINVG